MTVIPTPSLPASIREARQSIAFCLSCSLSFPFYGLASEHHAATGHSWTWDPAFIRRYGTRRTPPEDTTP